MKEQMELLQKIATDVAVIKTEIEYLKKDTIKQEEISKDVTQLKSQMNMVKWVSGVISTSLIGMLIVKIRSLV